MRPQRLSRRTDFRRVHRDGVRARRNGILVTAHNRSDEGPTRVGYSIRSVVGSAVVRNRIRRRLRAALGRCELASGFDVVVAADAGTRDVEFQILVEKLGEALSSVGVGAVE